MKKSGMRLAVLALVAAFAMPVMAQAAEADDAIKYRKWIMGTVGNHTQAFFAILQGKVPHQDALVYHARGLADAASHAKAAFEQNTAGEGTEKTTAKDKVWEGPDFNAGLDSLAADTAALADAVEAGDMAAIGPLAGAVGKDCKTCHDTFRDEHAN